MLPGYVSRGSAQMKAKEPNKTAKIRKADLTSREKANSELLSPAHDLKEFIFS